MTRRRLGWLIALLCGIGLAGTKISADDTAPATKKADAPQSSEAKRLQDDEDYELYKSLVDTVDQVERNYVTKLSRRELMEAAIKGIIGKLDPYSSYIGPDELESFNSAVESQFGGIGIQITIDGGQLKVLSPLIGTPAYKAGIQSGDRIVKIAGEPTNKVTLDEAVHKLKGDIDTSVTLTYAHAGSSKQETVTLKREVIHIETVLGDVRRDDDSWDFMLDHEQKIGYIRVTAFSRETAADLKKALQELADQKVRGLILDLRFNPGGLLTSAIEISDLFVPEGVIVSTQGRNTPKHTWEATKIPKFDGFPMVVLVNRYSASASEIVSACLQDHNRAIIVGERSWGKGSVQNVIGLEDGKSALKLTTASYQRPNGHNIHRFPDSKETDEWGVKPNDGFEVRLSDGDMSELMTYRRLRDILIAHPKADNPAGEDKPDTKNAPTPDKKEGAEAKPDAKPEVKPEGTPAEVAKAEKKPEFVDRQLQKGLEYLSHKLAESK